MLERTEVGGAMAYWAEGPYMLAFHGERGLKLRYLVQGHVLIWAEGGLPIDWNPTCRSKRLCA